MVLRQTLYDFETDLYLLSNLRGVTALTISLTLPPSFQMGILPCRLSSTRHLFIIELIRKNNSDYFELYLFHALRNRLRDQQQLQGADNARETLEVSNVEGNWLDF